MWSSLRSISSRRRRISERWSSEVMTLTEERGPGRRGWGACPARAFSWQSRLNSAPSWKSYGPLRPSAIRHAAIVQGRIEACPACRAIQAEANLLAGPCSGRHYLLTDPRQFGILQSGPGWRGTECNSTN
jgi:hypothetical protein